MQLLHQLTFRADREQDLHEARAHEPFRRDRRAAFAGVKPLEVRVERGECRIHHGLDLAQRMTRRHPFFKVHVAEQ